MRLCRRMVAMFESMVDTSFEEFQAQNNAPRIGRPALIVHDLADREVPWEEGERYARFWHDSRLLSTQGLGHNRIVDDPGVIDAAVRFLRGSQFGERVVSPPALDRKSVVSGKRVAVGVDLGGRRLTKKKNT